jgi:hypothetical protein
MTASKNEICNLALGHLGDFKVVDIDSPQNNTEFVCKRWYDVSRESALREGIFNFSIKRRIITADSETPLFGWAYQFTIPITCLRILSVGEDIEQDKYLINYSIEGQKILTDTEFADGMPIRYIDDVKDVGLFDSLFVEFLALKLAKNMCFDLNNDQNLKAQLLQEMEIKKLEALGSSGQESRPVIVNNSRYMNSRRSGNYPYKRRIY